MYWLTIKLYKVFFLLLLVISAYCVNAQSVKQLQFDAITIEDGLSQGMINCIIKDSYGFMWFATKDGLNRYDGFDFVIYKHDIIDTNSICDNLITYVFEDKQRRIWVGTSSGLSLFNRQTERFTNLNSKQPNMSVSVTSLITSIHQDAYNNIWVSTYDGVVQWHETLVNNKSVFKPTSYFKNETLLHIDKQSNIWVSVLDDALYRIKPNPKSLPVISKIPNSFLGVFQTKSNRRPVNAFVEDTLRHKMYFLIRHGITQLDLKSNKHSFLKSPTLKFGNFEKQIYIDTAQQIWYVESNTLLKYDVKNQTITNLTAYNNNIQKALNQPANIYCDNTGLIWIGTKGYGILKYHPRTEQFNFVNTSSVGFMMQAPGNKVILTQANLFISLYDVAHKKIFSISDSTFVNKVDFKNFGITTSAMFEDSNTVWLSKGKLSKYTFHNNKVQQFENGNLENFPVFLHDSLVYLGTPNAFSIFNPHTQTFKNYPYPIKVNKMPFNFLQKIYRASNGIFWLATTKGLFALDLKQNLWKHYYNKQGNLHSLSVDKLFSLCPDASLPEKYLWIGTDGGGLNRLDLETGLCKVYNTKSGLPNDVVYGILTDEKSNLWLSTNQGISCFNPTTETFINYNVKDGLQSNEFNRFAYCKTTDGCMFFGGVSGFNYFYPSAIKPLNNRPKLLITSIYINNKKEPSFNQTTYLNKPAYLTKNITLLPDANVITFEFATTDFIAPTKNRYQYMLAGFDKDWVQAGNLHMATYTNLDPGSYTFKVRGTNIDGSWNAISESLHIKIAAPWYKSWWFFTLIFLLICAIGYLYYRYRFYRTLEIANVRNRIARDLHDEVGSNLSSITIYNNVAMQKSNQPEVETLLQKIGFYSQTSLEAMNDIVWMITTNNDKFENIFSRMREHAINLLDEKCVLHINFDETLNAQKLQMEERRNFYLIYKEALNNILKYAKCKNVWIELKLMNTLILLRIKDDGIGFEMTDKELSKVRSSNGGNGLINMQNRAAMLQGELTLKSTPGQGTVLVLMFELKHSW